MPDTLEHPAIRALRELFDAQLPSATSAQALKGLQDAYVGRKSGKLTDLMKQIGTLSADERPAFGAQVNTLKADIEAALAARREALESNRPPAGAVDVTLPGRDLPIGRIHPLMRVRQQVEDIFTRMGYEILEGPEVEDDYHNFEALNMPPEHPARDMQDTLYLAAPIVGGTWGAHRGSIPEAQVRAATLLRTHTSAMQIRYMKTFRPPVRIIVPGRVYRRDNLDLSHTPMFQQFEGLVVGEHITLADLKGTLEAMMHELFGDVKVRLRPSFFPYTEPSAEVDVSCQNCHGAGCGTCKQTGWLEILGSGMVHPAVFEAVGYDPDKVTGFAFGLGMERVAMLKYGVDDIRLFYENDLRFLEQFPLVKILVSWLRDFVDVPGTAEEIARTMSVRGFAVEGIEHIGEDAVLDFEVTANRPDCLSVMGMAREVATAYGLQVRRPVVGAEKLGLVSLKPAGPLSIGLKTAGPPSIGLKTAGPPSAESALLEPADRRAGAGEAGPADIDVVIERPELCSRYAGAVADVTVGPSPAWMQVRLEAAGIRPISNIVDVTNYVLIELGHPMHAFDLATIGGAQIRVRTAAAGEKLKTLDGQTRELSPEMLVIADAGRAVAVAGVMGGSETEVTATTKAIVLESAYFNPISVRRTSKALGLKTEASMRFERGADPRLATTAMERACALLDGIGAGRARGTVVDRHPVRAEPTLLRLRREKIKGLLGADIPDADVRRILESLGFALRDSGLAWDVTVPTRRVDCLREVDLIEEIARHYGFDRLPVTFPALTSAPPPVDPRITRTRHLRTVLTAAGFSEAVTFGFIAEPAAAPFAGDGDLVPIANPLSENFSVLRPSALPGLIDAVSHNRRREQRDVRLFEVGNRFSRSAGERRAVAIAWTGMAGGDHWSGGTRQVDFFDIKGVAVRICEAALVESHTEPHSEPWLVPGQSAAVVANGTRIGSVGRLAPAVAETHGLPSSEAVYVAELDLDALDETAGSRAVRVEPLPRYPSVTRDISILVDDTLPAANVRATIRAAAPDTLVRVREFDRYQGKGIPDNKVSLSLRLTFRSSDRTLTDAEVQSAMDAILTALKTNHNAIQR